MTEAEPPKAKRRRRRSTKDLAELQAARAAWVKQLEKARAVVAALEGVIEAYDQLEQRK